MDQKQIDSVLHLVEYALRNGGRIDIVYHCKNEKAALQNVKDAAENLNTEINQRSYDNSFWYETNCKDLKRMEHPEQVVRLHEIASKFANRGLNVSTVRRSFQ
ncbi:hypothetical protein DT075_27655 [Bacillus licheniformis]|nr:hypothetical protein DT075_27655 [Bacillus licheniformis]